MSRQRLRAIAAIASGIALGAFILTSPAGAKSPNGNGNGKRSTTTSSSTTSSSTTSSSTTSTTVSSGGGGGGLAFANGILQADNVNAAGCGADGNANIDGEPAIEVARDNTLILGSERGLTSGSDAWRQDAAVGGAGASPCALTYVGQPNAVAGIGASGGDIDVAIGSAPATTGRYPVYVASLNGGSVSVAHSTDGGKTYTNVPVQGGLPVDDREWIAAYGANTSVMTFHDLATDNIDVLRSDDGGNTYTQIGTAIPATDYRSGANELGNIAVDRRNLAGTVNPSGGPGFWTYQAFVAPSSSSGSDYNEAFVSVSNDGGYTWAIKGVPCSVSSTGLDHMFPNVSVGPDGSVWLAWSDDTNVFAARSTDHGATWACSRVSTNTAQAMMPWIEAGSAGADLVYYASPTAPGKGSNQTWYVYAAQASATGGWGTPTQSVAVHTGSICESGFSCTSGRQLFDDFGVALDQSGFAHVAYSHDAPNLGGSGTYTGYLVQTAGPTVGYPN